MIITITTTAIIPPITPPAIAPVLLPPLSLSPPPPPLLILLPSVVLLLPLVELVLPLVVLVSLLPNRITNVYISYIRMYVHTIQWKIFKTINFHKILAVRGFKTMFSKNEAGIQLALIIT